MKIYGQKREIIIDSFKNGDITVAVYGLGKMGLPLAAIFADNGANVIGADINPDVVETINKGINTVKEEPGLDELVYENVKEGRLKATTNLVDASQDSDVMVILVPTLLDENNIPDIKIVESVCENIAEGLEEGDFVILESTAPPGTTDHIKTILEKSGLKAEKYWGLAHCPERTSSGRAIRDITQSYPKVVGGINPKSTETAEALYSVINEKGVIPVSDAKTAEAVKVFEGIYRDVNIALANELALICEELEINAIEAFKVANTQPYSNIHLPGVGVGGHCIPVYPYFLKTPRKGLIRLARKINDFMPQYTVNLVVKGLKTFEKKIENSNIMVLGISFRGGVKEIRWSPSLTIIKLLKGFGANVFVYDPLFNPGEIEELGVRYADQFDDMDCVVIASDHKEFRGYDWKEIGKKMRTKVVVDGRQIVDPDQLRKLGYIYLGIGYI